MAIKALGVATIPFVSELDPEYNSVVKNQAQIDKAIENDKAPPEPILAHGPDATVFDVAPISSTLMSIITDRTTVFDGDGGMVMRGAQNDVLVARIAIKGWKNFDEVEFETVEEKLGGLKVEMLSPECTSRIPMAILREIGRRAKEDNSISGVQAKNSASVSSPSNSSESGTVNGAPSA